MGVGRHCDGRGLYLLVKATGMRSWVFRYRKNGKLRDMGLGGAGTYGEGVSLPEARKRAAALMKSIRAGLDPFANRAVVERRDPRQSGEELPGQSKLVATGGQSDV